MCVVKEQGFEIVPNLFSRETISSLAESLEKAAVLRSRAGIRSAIRVPAVRSIANDGKLLRIAGEILGTNATPFRATLFDKSHRSNWLVPWHQDTALPIFQRQEAPGWGPWSVKEGVICAHAPASALEQILAVRFHLDDSTKENGSLRVLPKTHTLGILTDNELHDLAARIPATDCFIQAGGILVMRPLLVHSSSKAEADNIRRRILHIEYAASASFAGGIQLRVW